MKITINYNNYADNISGGHTKVLESDDKIKLLADLSAWLLQTSNCAVPDNHYGQFAGSQKAPEHLINWIKIGDEKVESGKYEGSHQNWIVSKILREA